MNLYEKKMSATATEESDKLELNDDELATMFITSSHMIMYEDDVIEDIENDEEPQEWVEYNWTARPSALATQRTEDTLRQLLPFFNNVKKERYLKKILPNPYTRGEKVSFRTKCGWRDGVLKSINGFLSADIEIGKITIFDWDVINLRKQLHTDDDIVAYDRLITRQMIKIISNIKELPHDARRVINRNRDDLNNSRTVWFNETADYPTIIGTLYIDGTDSYYEHDDEDDIERPYQPCQPHQGNYCDSAAQDYYGPDANYQPTETGPSDFRHDDISLPYYDCDVEEFKDPSKLTEISTLPDSEEEDDSLTSPTVKRRQHDLDVISDKISFGYPSNGWLPY